MKNLLSTAFVLVGLAAYGQDSMSKENIEAVSRFVKAVKSGDREMIALRVYYPLRRAYPIPPVEDKDEFLKRYNEIFDAALVRKIEASDPQKDWSIVGWRGIMLYNGDVWLDEDGQLEAVNDQSAAEVKMRDELIKKDRLSIHPSLRSYKEPVCIMETAKYRVRIDDMGEGDYRYASWPISKKMSEKPDIIIEHGTVNFDGSGGNHTYTFKNNGYTYDCDVIVMGENTAPPAMLTISKGQKVILRQDAKKFRD